MNLDFKGWKPIAVRTKARHEIDPLPNAVLTMVEAEALVRTKAIELVWEKAGNSEVCKVRVL